MHVYKYSQIDYGNESREKINEFMIIIVIRFASNH